MIQLFFLLTFVFIFVRPSESDVVRYVASPSECEGMDSTAKAECIAEVNAGWKFRAISKDFKSKDGAAVLGYYAIDETEEISITGEDTTITKTKTRNRSSHEVAEAIDRLTGTIRFIYVVTLVATVAGFIFLN